MLLEQPKPYSTLRIIGGEISRSCLVEDLYAMCNFAHGDQFTLFKERLKLGCPLERCSRSEELVEWFHALSHAESGRCLIDQSQTKPRANVMQVPSHGKIENSTEIA